jgi:hypothetical protein
VIATPASPLTSRILNKDGLYETPTISKKFEPAIVIMWDEVNSDIHGRKIYKMGLPAENQFEKNQPAKALCVYASFYFF